MHAVAADVARRVDLVIAAGERRAEPLLAWWRAARIPRVWVPRAALVVLCVWYFGVFTSLVWDRHEFFGSFDYDLGMYDQGIWQLSHGRGFMTVRGMHVFGHHANIGYLLLVPFYWVGLGGPHFLNILNTLGVVAVAWPLSALVRRHLRSDWAAFWVVVAYLFHFAPQWKIQETFHAESLAAPFLVGALYFASVSRWRWYWWCIAGAIIWKEDVAIAVAVLGLAVAVLVPDGRRRGLITAAVGAVWFVVATKLFIPFFSEEGAVFDGLFGPLGSSATEVVATSLRHPSRLFETIQCHGWIDGQLSSLSEPVEGVQCPTPQEIPETSPPQGLGALAGAYGWVPVLWSPMVLLIGMPQHVVNYATTASFTWDLRWHYAFIPYLAVLMAAVWTVIRRRRAVSAWFLVVVMLVGVFNTREEGVGPWTENADIGFWTERRAWDGAMREALEFVRPDDAVSAAYYVVPHLSHREHVYTFPNPWRGSNYGLGGSPAPPSPELIDVLVMMPNRLNDAEGALWDEVVGSGAFELEYRERIPESAGGAPDVVEVWRRVDDDADRDVGDP